MTTRSNTMARINALTREIREAEMGGQDARVLWLLAIKARLHAGLMLRTAFNRLTRTPDASTRKATALRATANSIRADMTALASKVGDEQLNSADGNALYAGFASDFTTWRTRAQQVENLEDMARAIEANATDEGAA